MSAVAIFGGFIIATTLVTSLLIARGEPQSVDLSVPKRYTKRQLKKRLRIVK